MIIIIKKVQVKEKVSIIICNIIYSKCITLFIIIIIYLKIKATFENEVESQNHNKHMKIIPTQAVVQVPITNYVSRPLSTQDSSHFCSLFFNMIISNGLPFSFAENPETRELFKFCTPIIKLPTAKTLSGAILTSISEDLVKKNIAIAQKDLNGVTAAFDGWVNVRSKHLFGVMFIASEGKTITWDAKD